MRKETSFRNKVIAVTGARSVTGLASSALFSGHSFSDALPGASQTYRYNVNGETISENL